MWRHNELDAVLSTLCSTSSFFYQSTAKSHLDIFQFPILAQAHSVWAGGLEWRMVVMVSGRWGVFWNLEVETGGKAGWGGGRFLTKDREIWSQTGLTEPEDTDLRSAHLYLPSLLLGLGFERVQADLGSEPGGRSAAGGWVTGLRQLHSPANTPTQSIQMYPLNITILYHMTCEKNIFQIKLFRN